MNTKTSPKNTSSQEIDFSKVKIIKKKFCNGCEKIKTVDEFYKRSKLSDTVQYRCKKCGIESATKNHKNNLERDKKQHKEWRKSRPGYDKEYYDTHKPQLNAYARQYWNKPENRKRKNANHRAYVKRNYEEVRDRQKEARRKKRETLNGRLSENYSGYMRLSLKNGKCGISWKKLVGYDIKELKKHLRKTMPKGYSWQDYMKGKLHVDHIIPLAAFHYESINDLSFKRCWALSNLQLLPAQENRIKQDKLIGEFQQNLPLKML